MSEEDPSIQFVENLVQECTKYNLEGLDKLEPFSTLELERIYNGTGADWMPERARKALDFISRDLLPIVLIHDVEFKLGGSREDFYQANERLRRNGDKLARAKYGWWRLRRYRLIAQANLFADICHIAGWVAFNRVEW